MVPAERIAAAESTRSAIRQLAEPLDPSDEIPDDDVGQEGYKGEAAQPP